MKKRGVSPVIATVLLIALVTAAAAIVFLVVIPMLQPTATPAFIYDDGASNIGGGQYRFSVDIKVTGGSLTIDNVTVVPVLTISVVNATDHTMIGYNIDEATVTVFIKGAFIPGTDYTFTFSFSSGEDKLSEDITINA